MLLFLAHRDIVYCILLCMPVTDVSVQNGLAWSWLTTTWRHWIEGTINSSGIESRTSGELLPCILDFVTSCHLLSVYFALL